jgi:hypothetical protein
MPWWIYLFSSPGLASYGKSGLMSPSQDRDAVQPALQRRLPGVAITHYTACKGRLRFVSRERCHALVIPHLR